MSTSPDISQKVRDAYQERAKIYDTNKNPTRDLNARILRQVTLPLDGQYVLEIGCGTGLNTRYLARHAAEMLGIDISQNMPAVAHKRVTDDSVPFGAGDITHGWPFESETFNVIVANLVLEHIEELPHIFEEALRVLHGGGQFYLAEYCIPTSNFSSHRPNM